MVKPKRMTKLVQHQANGPRRSNAAIDQAAAADTAIRKGQLGSRSEELGTLRAGPVTGIDDSSERYPSAGRACELVPRGASKGRIQASDCLPVGGFG